jgi:hypothetical protein
MAFIRDLKRKLRFKLIRLEILKSAAHVETLRILGDRLIDDPEERKKRQDEYRQENKEIREQFETRLMTSVGKALSAWAGLEQILVSITSMLLDTSLSKTGVVMYSIINFNAWLAIISDLFLQDETFSHLKSRWDKLTSRLHGLKDMRDRIAHHSVFSADTPAEIIKHTSLLPSPFDSRSKTRKHHPLHFTQVEEFYQAVIAALSELQILSDEIDKAHTARIARLEAEFAKHYNCAPRKE